VSAARVPQPERKRGWVVEVVGPGATGRVRAGVDPGVAVPAQQPADEVRVVVVVDDRAGPAPTRMAGGAKAADQIGADQALGPLPGSVRIRNEDRQRCPQWRTIDNPSTGSECMIRTRRHTNALASTGMDGGPPRQHIDNRAPSEHHSPT
jgi:hypothetical protein